VRAVYLKLKSGENLLRHHPSVLRVDEETCSLTCSNV
jgi:hypothetical protein